MNPHRVHVLHVADGDAGVRAVAHHFVLNFLPADQATFNENLPDWAGCKPHSRLLIKLFRRIRDTTARSAKRVGGPYDHGQAEAFRDNARVLDGRHHLVLWHRLAYFVQHLPEQVAILRRADSLQRRAQQTDVVFLKHTGLRQIDGEIEAGLAAQCGQQAVRLLALDHARDGLNRQRLNVDDVRDLMVGHDRRGVRVDEDGRDTLLAEGAAGLRARVVKLGGLADDYRPAAEHKHPGRAIRRGRHAALRPGMIMPGADTSSCAPAKLAGTHDS